MQLLSMLRLSASFIKEPFTGINLNCFYRSNYIYIYIFIFSLILVYKEKSTNIFLLI